MIIKVTENAKKGGWNLWVTEKPGDDQAPIVMASGRSREQITAMLRVLFEEADAARVIPTPAPVVTVAADQLSIARRHALGTLRAHLDGWIQGAKENHEALDHRTENKGEECWRHFAPEDIRTMINDACRELGLLGFPAADVNVEDR